MTIYRPRNKRDGFSDSIDVSYCQGCEEYHLRLADVDISLSRSEFSDLISESWNCLYKQEANVVDHLLELRELP